jgi:hypothetical protein
MVRDRTQIDATSANLVLPKLILVMGVQRSGGTTFLHAFNRDPNLTILKQVTHSEIYSDTHLRPEAQIRDYLCGCKKTVVLEPKSETKFRDLSTVLNEFAAYPITVLWNYANPVSVYARRLKRYPHKAGIAHEEEFIQMWLQRQQRALDAYKEYPNTMVFVRLEDIVQDPRVFWKTCAALGIRGTYRFYKDKECVQSQLSTDTRQRIEQGTAEMINVLDQKRIRIPRTNKITSTCMRHGLYVWNYISGIWRLIAEKRP